MARIRTFATVLLMATAVSLTDGGLAHAEPSGLTYEQIAALPQAEQARILDPLRAVAQAADQVGKAGWSSLYSGLEIDASAGKVTVYLTDLSRQGDFVAAARKQDSKADLRLARFAQGAHTLAELNAARDALMVDPNSRDLTIESVAIPADGSSLRVRAMDVARARHGLSARTARLQSLATSVPVTVEQAEAGSDKSRLRDTPQWISGEALTQTSDPSSIVWTCTSGLPARRNSDGRSFLITAAHCYGDGATVYTGWESGGRNRIGTVARRDNLDDAIAIDTSSTGTTASREWDGKRPGPYQVLDVTLSAFSYNGDLTCQDGYTSGIVCGLRVNNGNVTWTGSNGVVHRGVEAHQVNGTTAAQPGDSGGLVFALLSGNVRQARGVNSYAGGTMLRWTEAPYIFSNFGMTLAP
ncbi:hypothetical protein [Micromonospora sp. NPDC005806]|uniref:hypothetical protein n=1 Tax=Micromonospora sp. NPDC005806 TaxID=3364234 RepID=UPI0036A98C76